MKMTASEFRQLTEENPNWCSKITEPIEVIEYLNMNGSNIEALSPLLIFSEKHGNEGVASFQRCPNLKIAEGTFHGFVTFNKSGIEEIGDLKITQPNDYGRAAYFYSCSRLKIARGTYPGFVSFSHSGIEKSTDLVVTKPDMDGDAAYFDDCPNLKRIRGEFNGKLTGEVELIEEYYQYLDIREIQKQMAKEPILEL